MRKFSKIGVFALLLGSLNLVSAPPAFASPVYNFTNAGATGPQGPIQSQVNSSYSGTTLAGAVTVIGSGLQRWTVPTSGLYEIVAAGAAGGYNQSPGREAGRGVVLTSRFNLTQGETITILVGQNGLLSSASAAGGGGGTFVLSLGTAKGLMVAAGGGGGAGRNGAGVNASTSTTANDATSGSQGGTESAAGNIGSSFCQYYGGSGGGASAGANGMAGSPNGGLGGGGGAGYRGNGGRGNNSSDGYEAKSYSNGGVGGSQSYFGWGDTANAAGGFGGGGTGTSYSGYDGGGGGGGGYTGGGGGNGSCPSPYVANKGLGGGGGGSYSSGTDQSSALNSYLASGYVTITSLGPSVSSFAPTTTLTNSSSLTYNLVFTQSVTGLAANDFSVSGTGSSTCTIGTPSGSGTTYSVSLSGCSPGTVILTLASNSITNSSSQTGPTSNTAAATVVIDQTAPTISSVSAPSNATYIPAGALNFTVNFSESVTVTGIPRLTLTVGSLTKYATFVSLTDSKTATFRYTVATASGEFDTDGIAVSTTLDLNSGAIADLATNALSPLTFTAPTLTSVLVAQTPAAPTITSITPSSGTLSVAFTAGATNGSAITNYQYSSDNGANWKNRATGTTASPLVITTVSPSASNLANGTSYNVRIRAVNAAGSGDSSTAVSATPSAVVITGDATLTTTYGSAASTTTYTSAGGTGPYTYTLSATPSGVSIASGVVTASSSTTAGTYTQNVISTDSAGTPQTGLKQLVITVNKASTTISIALPSNATDAALGGAITITATVSQAGAVNFKLGGSSISGCSAVSSSAGSATCSWTPGALGGASLTAVLTPTDSTNYENATTSTLSITVVNGVTTVSLALAGGVTQTGKGQNIVITATVDQAGRISFFADGKRIPGCYNKAVSGSTKTCTWKPTIQKQVTLTSRLVPTNNAYSTATESMKVWVVRRTGTR